MTTLFALPFTVDANGFARSDKFVEFPLDLSGGFRQFGGTALFDDTQLRLVETDPTGNVIDGDVLFQFDRSENFSAALPTIRAIGDFTFLLKGNTPTHATRYFQLRYEDHVQRREAGLLKVKMVQDEGQECFQIITPAGTYFYQLRGAGFCSLVDQDGNDWIGFHPWGGSDGKYRGIPNLSLSFSGFHPGFFNCHSSIVNEGILKVTILSESNNGLDRVRWDIFPSHARLTVLKASVPYWFLYEGTPNGGLDLESGYVQWSNGTRHPLSESWDAKLPEPRWLYFGNDQSKRAIYFHHQENDGEIDSYWPMQKNMTVFGFGRLKGDKSLTMTPAQFSFGLIDSVNFDEARMVIDDICQPVTVELLEYTT